MKKTFAVLTVIAALFGFSLLVKAQSPTVVTVTFTNRGQQFLDSEVHRGGIYDDGFNIAKCSNDGLAITQINNQPVVVSDTSTHYCPGWISTFNGPGWPNATIGFPDGTFDPNWPSFIGEGLVVTRGPLTAGTNDMYPTATFYHTDALVTGNGSWTGTTTQWYTTYVARTCTSGRGSTCKNVTRYKNVGGSGSFTATF